MPEKQHRCERSATYCKSRMFRMHFIFVHFVRGGFRTKIKCILKIESKSENPQRSVVVRKFHAYERSGVPRIRKFSAYEIFWIYSMVKSSRAQVLGSIGCGILGSTRQGHGILGPIVRMRTTWDRDHFHFGSSQRSWKPLCDGRNWVTMRAWVRE